MIPNKTNDSESVFKKRFDIATRLIYGTQFVSPRASSLDVDGGIILRDKKGNVLATYTGVQLDEAARQEAARQARAEAALEIARQAKREEEEKNSALRRKYKAHNIEQAKAIIKSLHGLDLECTHVTSFRRNGRYTNCYTSREYRLSGHNRVFSTLLEVCEFLEGGAQDSEEVEPDVPPLSLGARQEIERIKEAKLQAEKYGVF